MRNFFLLGSWFSVALFSFFNELPPVKFVIVEKPAIPEGLPVLGPLFQGAAIQKSAWRMYCKKKTPAGADA